MNHVNIFFSVIIIFLIVLFLTGFIFVLSSPEFEKYIKSSSSFTNSLKFLIDHIIKLHPHFIIFSLFITFALYYAFIDLKQFHTWYYILLITTVPLILCAGIYYFENYIFDQLYKFKSSIIVSSLSDNCSVNIISELKIYLFSFIIYIIIPSALLFNNRKWYLKTVIFFLVYLILVMYGFKYVNEFILNLAGKINIPKGFNKNPLFKSLPEMKEIILVIIHILIGLNIFRAADSVRGIRKRIDVGKIKKIQH